MHKKRVGNNYYFYTTIRDKEKTNSVYLGRNYENARLKESRLKNKISIIPLLKFDSFNAYNIFLVVIFMVSLFSIIYFNLGYTAFVIVSQFNNTNTAENLTLYQNITTNNITRYISLNKYVNVSSAYMNLSGFNKFLNQSDGFYIGSAGADGVTALTTNGSDFWVIDDEDDVVYHFDRTGNNMSDGFYIRDTTGIYSYGITTNGSDFWISDYGNDMVYHFNSSGDNQSDSFDIAIAGNTDSLGITTNGSDFWVIDDADDFVYHYNSSGDNQSDGFRISIIGSTAGNSIVTNGSDFWISDVVDSFIYHLNSSGDNQSDGFSISNLFSSTYITTNVTLPHGTPTDFWLTNNFDSINHISNKYPSNPFLDIGNESVIEWEHSENFNLVNNKTRDLAPEINIYLSSCTADENGNCSIPFVFGSRTTGILQYSDIKIDYADIVNPTATLTPSSNTQLSLGQSVTLTCSGSDVIGMKSVSMSIDGSNFCSGVSSCSGSYPMGNTNSKIVVCTATDTSDNGDSKSIILSVPESGGGGGGGGTGGGPGSTPTTPTTPTEPVTPPTGEVTPPSSIATEVIGQIGEETGIEVIDPGEEYSPINIPQSEITSAIVDNNVVVSLGNIADIVYSYINVEGKPRVDIKFNQVDLKYVGDLVSVRYFDVFELAIKILTGLIFTLMIYNLFRIRRV